MRCFQARIQLWSGGLYGVLLTRMSQTQQQHDGLRFDSYKMAMYPSYCQVGGVFDHLSIRTLIAFCRSLVCVETPSPR